MNYLFKIFFLILFVSSAWVVKGQEFPKRPVPQRLVNDFTGTLTPDQIQTLEQRLVAFDDSTSTQIAVVLIKSVEGYDIAEYAVDLGRAWGIGDEKKDNGILLLVAKDDRRLNISTGYGIEGALPDITSKHIIEDIIKPNFKGEDYYRGIYLGTDAIMKAVRGEYTAPPKKKSGKPGKMTFIIIAIILFLLFSGGSRGGGKFMSRRGSRDLTGPLIWGSLLGGGGGGGWGGGGSSGGGGGFGGFGGGSFGGGGASGSW